jgi:hypothetical protein
MDVVPKPKNPIKSFQFRWNEPLGEKECPYAYRWVLNLGFFSIRMHRWIRSDDKRYFHDHPWWFWTLVLRGGYTDVTPSGEDVLTRGSIRFRPSHHQHYVRIPKEGALTILLCGPQSRNWGFWVKGNHLRPLRFFSRHGHPPCSEQ